MSGGFYSYDIDTQSGQEGSPLLVKSLSKWTVVGVHLGYSQTFNSGLAKMFTQEDTESIKSYFGEVSVLNLNEEYTSK